MDPENLLDYNLTYRDSAERFEPSELNPIAMSATRAMLAMFTGLGMSYIENRIVALTDILSEGIRSKGHKLLSPRGPSEKSGIVTFVNADGDLEGISARLHEARIVHTCRWGVIRLSPHFYNSEAEVEEVLNLL